MLTVSVILSINKFESSNTLMILIISFISSFKKKKKKSFSCSESSFSTYFSFKFISPGKLSLAKGIAIFVSTFLVKLANQEPKDPPD